MVTRPTLSGHRDITPDINRCRHTIRSGRTDGYRLLENAFSDARSNDGVYGSSGFFYPLAYNESTGDLRAFDGDGRVLWNHPTGQDLTFRVQGYGSNTLCLIGVSLLNDTGFMSMKVQPCQAGSVNPFVRVSEASFLGSDGTRLLAVDSRDLVCIDEVTGNELWRERRPQIFLSEAGWRTERTPTMTRL